MMELLMEMLVPVGTSITGVLPFICVLSLLVFVHEWGHYYAARKCGVRVLKFSIGFGRELFGRTDKNGTRWKFCLIPLGGYVQMFGDSDPASARAEDTVTEDGQETRAHTDEEKQVAFYAQPIWKRSLIVFAGPAINFIFAIILFSGLYTIHGQPYVAPVVGKMIEGGPADLAGIELDDRFIRINDRKIEDFQDIVRAVSLYLDSELTIEIASYEGDNKWSDETRIVKLTPELITEEDKFGFINSRGRIGIYGPENIKAEVREFNPLSATYHATAETFRLTSDTLKALGQMITGARSSDEIGGVIRIGTYAKDVSEKTWVELVIFIALISVNLGLINLFPIPMLDGGHLMFYAIEAIKGEKLNEKVAEYMLAVGLFIVVSFMLFATWNDLKQAEFLADIRAIFVASNPAG